MSTKYEFHPGDKCISKTGELVTLHCLIWAGLWNTTEHSNLLFSERSLINLKYAPELVKLVYNFGEYAIE